VDVFTRVALSLVLTFIPLTAATQPKWDVAGTVGLFAGYTPRRDGRGGYQDTWFHNVLGGAIVGRHVNRDWKLELETTTTTAGTQFRERYIVVPDVPYPYPIGSEVTSSVTSVAVAVTHQFRDNEWVHPFVQVGVSADFDRVTVRTWEQFVCGTPRPGVPQQRLSVERIDGPTTSTFVRGLIGGGAKVYLSERAFVRPDARWSSDGRRHHFAFRLGLGVDF
jgi:hypothetical protein